MNLFKITLTSFLAGSFLVNAQVSDECKKNASLGIESAKIKNYTEAEPYLKKVRQNCPSYSLATYVSYERLLRARLKGLKKKKAPLAERKAVANEIIILLKERKQYFPAKTKDGKILSDIALLKHENQMADNYTVYSEFNTAYKKDKKNFKGPKQLYTYFALLVDLQKEGKKSVSDIFDLYDDLSEKVDLEQTNTAKVVTTLSEKEESGASLLSKEKKKLDRAEKKLKVFGQVTNSIDAKAAKFFTCDYLTPLLNEQLTANQNNIEWIKSSARRLYKKGCTDQPLFKTLVKKQHSLEPSAATANYLGKLAEQDGNNTEAFKYYNEAAELEADPKKKADIYGNLANNFKKKGSYGKARQYYRKALQNKPNYGGAYIQIASMVAKSANNCGSDEFNKRAVYWLAANYARKAKRVQPSISKYTDKLIANYMGSAPTKTMVFTKGMQGKTISIGCWIGESVRVPNL